MADDDDYHVRALVCRLVSLRDPCTDQASTQRGTTPPPSPRQSARLRWCICCGGGFLSAFSPPPAIWGAAAQGGDRPRRGPPHTHRAPATLLKQHPSELRLHATPSGCPRCDCVHGTARPRNASRGRGPLLCSCAGPCATGPCEKAANSLDSIDRRRRSHPVDGPKERAKAGRQAGTCPTPFRSSAAEDHRHDGRRWHPPHGKQHGHYKRRDAAGLRSREGQHSARGRDTAKITGCFTTAHSLFGLVWLPVDEDGRTPLDSVFMSASGHLTAAQRLSL